MTHGHTDIEIDVDGDIPARIQTDGVQAWYQHDQLHRDEDRPVLINTQGSQRWYHHGRPHREEDQPAWIQANGEHQWYCNGIQYTPASIKLCFESDQKALLFLCKETYKDLCMSLYKEIQTFTIFTKYFCMKIKF